MTTRSLARLFAALCCAAPFCTAGPAAAAVTPGPSFQFGPLPAPEHGAVWEMAIPIEGTDAVLETADDRLSLVPAPAGDRTWLVFAARRIGPLSALLRVRDAGGHARAVAVAGEVVPRAAFRGFLLRGATPGAAIERYVRAAGRPIGALRIPGATVAAADGASGWTHLRVRLPAGMGESDGTLEADGRTLPVHASLLESITVAGSILLDPDFEPARLRAIDEDLQGSRMSGRIGVLGRRGDKWQLRMLQAVPDGPTVTFSSRGFQDVAPVGTAGELAHLTRLHHLGGEATGERFLALTPGRASIVNPVSGVLARYADARMSRIAAARQSRLDENRIYAITGNGDGEWFLSGLQARRTNGIVEITRTRYTPSLQSFLGARELLVGDIGSIVYPRVNGLRENLLVTVGNQSGDLNLVELEPSGATVSATPRYGMQVVDPRQLPAVQMDVLPTRLGAYGLPARVRVNVPGQEVRVLQVDAPGSWSVLGREVLGVPLLAAGVALRAQHFMITGPDGQGGGQLLRYRYDPMQDLLIGQASGATTAAPLDYLASARGEHSWLLGRDALTGRGTVQLLTNGLPAGTDHPPVVNAGPDVETTVSRVYLIADAEDADGDPVAVRWYGTGVEFTDRFARFTTARVPRGTSRIMVRARSAATAASAPGAAQGTGALTDADVVVVHYGDVTAVGPEGPGRLATAIGRPEPNPSSARTRIPFTLAGRAHVRVEVFDLHGRRLRTLVDADLDAGGHDAVWNGEDAAGVRAAAGVYFARLTAGARTYERRIVFAR